MSTSDASSGDLVSYVRFQVGMCLMRMVNDVVGGDMMMMMKLLSNSDFTSNGQIVTYLMVTWLVSTSDMVMVMTLLSKGHFSLDGHMICVKL